MSSIGPSVMNANKEPVVNVPTNARARKTSTVEQTLMTKASACMAKTEPTGPWPIESTSSWEARVWMPAASRQPITRNLPIWKNSPIANSRLLATPDFHESRSSATSMAPPAIAGEGTASRTSLLRVWTEKTRPTAIATKIVMMKRAANTVPNPKAAAVLKKTTIFTTGAANKNVIPIDIGIPLVRSLRTTGTTPHSQTGNTIPSNDPAAAPARGFLGAKRSTCAGETKLEMKPDTVVPRSRKGTASMNIPRKRTLKLESTLLSACRAAIAAKTTTAREAASQTREVLTARADMAKRDERMSPRCPSCRPAPRLVYAELVRARRC